MCASKRKGGRLADELRPTSVVPNPLKYPAGSARIEMGDTHVLCSACVQEGTPPFLAGKGRGWVTAEYGMLPGSTGVRKDRRMDGRMQEIRRLIGRCLRMAVDRRKLGERTLVLDCDVLQADGGTRTASVTGAWVALALAVGRLRADGVLAEDPLKAQIAAVSVGMVKGEPLLDLSYGEDSAADVAMSDSGGFVEVQATGEGGTFGADEMNAMLDLAARGCRELFEIQRRAVEQGLA